MGSGVEKKQESHLLLYRTCKGFQLHLMMGFPRAPLILEFLLGAFLGAHCPADLRSPRHGVSEMFLIWEMPSVCLLCPWQRDQRSFELPHGAEGLPLGAVALSEEDTAEGVSKLISS